MHNSKGETLAGAYPIKHVGIENQANREIIGQAGASIIKDIFVPDHSDASKLSFHEKFRSKRDDFYPTEEEE